MGKKRLIGTLNRTLDLFLAACFLTVLLLEHVLHIERFSSMDATSSISNGKENKNLLLSIKNTVKN